MMRDQYLWRDEVQAAAPDGPSPAAVIDALRHARGQRGGSQRGGSGLASCFLPHQGKAKDKT
jgi:hypothetical protein